MDRRTFLTLTLAAPAYARHLQAAAGQSSAGAVAWTQWGGPHRNFQTEATGIKDTWPASGPRVMWKRPLGEGYSSPAVENGVLYTSYGKPGEEVVIAAQADSGKTVWERTNPMTFQSDVARDMPTMIAIAPPRNAPPSWWRAIRIESAVTARHAETSE